MRRADRTDHQLVALARDGDPEAFDEIVARYRPAIVRYCAGQTRPERVDDAVQQTFLNAWLALERGAPVRELRPWLYSIARNAAIDQLRSQRAEVVELSPDLAGGADPAHVTAQRDEVSDVLRAVSELPERQRTALIETAVHGRATEHVADEMGMSGGALRQLVHRARTSVRGMVASVLPTPLASWFAQTGGEEGTRRAASLLGGAGQGAAGVLAAATATAASVGAIGTAGITTLSTTAVVSERRSLDSAPDARAGATKQSPSSSAAQSTGERDAATIVRLPSSDGATSEPRRPATSAAGTTEPDAPSSTEADDAAQRRGGSERRAASERPTDEERRETKAADGETRRAPSHDGGTGDGSEPATMRPSDRVNDQTFCRTDHPRASRVAPVSAKSAPAASAPAPEPAAAAPAPPASEPAAAETTPVDAASAPASTTGAPSATGASADPAGSSGA